MTSTKTTKRTKEEVFSIWKSKIITRWNGFSNLFFTRYKFCYIFRWWNVDDAIKYFSQRTHDIVKANRWLTGFLDWDDDDDDDNNKNLKLSLFIPQVSEEVKNPFTVLDIGPLSHHYHTVVKSLEPALCGTTYYEVSNYKNNNSDNNDTRQYIRNRYCGKWH